MYKPDKEMLLKHSDTLYYEKTPQIIALKDKLDSIMGADGEAERIVNGIHKLCAQEARIKEITDYLSDMGIVFNSFEDLQEIIGLIMNVHNTTRMWSNYGHTPMELRSILNKESAPLGNYSLKSY